MLILVNKSAPPQNVSSESQMTQKMIYTLASFISKVTGQAGNPDDLVDIDHKLPTEDTD